MARSSFEDAEQGYMIYRFPTLNGDRYTLKLAIHILAIHIKVIYS